jgi:hypothetical protein
MEDWCTRSQIRLHGIYPAAIAWFLLRHCLGIDRQFAVPAPVRQTVMTGLWATDRIFRMSRWIVDVALNIRPKGVLSVCIKLAFARTWEINPPSTNLPTGTGSRVSLRGRRSATKNLFMR